MTPPFRAASKPVIRHEAERNRNTKACSGTGPPSFMHLEQITFRENNNSSSSSINQKTKQPRPPFSRDSTRPPLKTDRHPLPTWGRDGPASSAAPPRRSCSRPRCSRRTPRPSGGQARPFASPPRLLSPRPPSAPPSPPPPSELLEVWLGMPRPPPDRGIARLIEILAC